MKQGMKVCSLLLVLACVSVNASMQKASPVDKVISMMNDMLVKAKREKQDEKVRFAAFSQFCKDTTVEKKNAIEKGNADIERLRPMLLKQMPRPSRLQRRLRAMRPILVRGPQPRSKPLNSARRRRERLTESMLRSLPMRKLLKRQRRLW